MDKKKIIFWLVWLGLISLGPITVLSNTPFSSVIGNRVLLVNLFQRILGSMAFTLIFIQIILGSFMHKWIDKLGGWIFKFHVIEGITAYTLVVLHPLTFVILNYFMGKGFDPFYVYVDVCLLCDGKLDFFYNFGRVGFWLITCAVSAALFRATIPFLRLHWRKIHILNYLAFFSIWFHSLKLGTDMSTGPFRYFHNLALVVIAIIVFFKVWSLYRTSRDTGS